MPLPHKWRAFYVIKGKGVNPGPQLALTPCSLTIHTAKPQVELMSHYDFPSHLTCCESAPFPINIKMGLFKMWRDVISLPVSFLFSSEQLILALNSWPAVNLRLATEMQKAKSAKRNCKRCFVHYFLPPSSLCSPPPQNQSVSGGVPATTSSVLYSRFTPVSFRVSDLLLSTHAK